MGKVDWRAQVLIPVILYMLSDNLTISLTSSTSPKAMILRFTWYLKPDSSQIILGNDWDLRISLRSLGISLCFKEVIVAILEQVRVILVLGISPDHWGFLCVSKTHCDESDPSGKHIRVPIIRLFFLYSHLPIHVFPLLISHCSCLSRLWP